MASQDPPIILYHYSYSPYARRVVWYLTLRGIPYSQCMQPPILPRPDIAKLGIKYRRIPILSIGRDVYLDTRLILQKLEQLHPSSSSPHLGATGPEQQAIERLLEAFAVDGGLFARAAQLIPPDLPLLKDPAFTRDRAELNGGARPPSSEAMQAVRPEAVNEVRRAVELLETTLLADGRDWLLKTERPSLADIEAVWPLHWLASLPGALPPDQVSAGQFPKVFAWIERFQGAVADAKKSQAKAPALSGDQATEAVVNASYAEAEAAVDEGDGVVREQGLRKGGPVTVWPLDSGSAHRDTGRLVGIDGREVVFETRAGESSVRVHAPRHGFRVRAHSDRAANL